ncbi:MAG: sterol desaturase family protein [Ilumatobacteraceae bacterium]
MDLSVAVAPLYVAAMATEDRVLRRRAAKQPGRVPVGYERSDTRTSLLMGAGSLTVPVWRYLGSQFVPKRGRFGNLLVIAAAGTVVGTTVADRWRDRAGPRAERAGRIASVGGVASVVSGALIATSGSAYLSAAARQWSKRRRDLGTGPLAWAAALVGWDLVYYWNHRLMHEVRAMWAIHVVHHSSERYNLSTALRQPVASAFGVWVPYGGLARLGVRPTLIELSRSINLIYQFWIHTEAVGRLAAAEAVLNTPSHHRVHHGSNPAYLDRNHAGILILWDRWFGTFQAEEPAEPVVYGLTRNIHTDSPWTVATHEYRAMFADVARARTWRDRLGFVLRSPGWAHRRRAQLDDAPALRAQGVAA